MRTRRVATAVLLASIVVLLGAGCSSAPLGPTYTQEELKRICERQRGVWHADQLMGGYCEFRTA